MGPAPVIAEGKGLNGSKGHVQSAIRRLGLPPKLSVNEGNPGDLFSAENAEERSFFMNKLQTALALVFLPFPPAAQAQPGEQNPGGMQHFFRIVDIQDQH